MHFWGFSILVEILANWLLYIPNWEIPHWNLYLHWKNSLKLIKCLGTKVEDIFHSEPRQACPKIRQAQKKSPIRSQYLQSIDSKPLRNNPDIKPPIFSMLQKSILATQLKMWKYLRRNLTGMMMKTMERLYTSWKSFQLRWETIDFGTKEQKRQQQQVVGSLYSTMDTVLYLLRLLIYSREGPVNSTVTIEVYEFCNFKKKLSRPWPLFLCSRLEGVPVSPGFTCSLPYIGVAFVNWNICIQSEYNLINAEDGHTHMYRCDFWYVFLQYIQLNSLLCFASVT